MTVRYTIGALVVLSALCTGCDSDGLSEDGVRAIFEEHRAEFEELRAMVEEDAETSDLRSVSSDPGERALCGTQNGDQACLSEHRRLDYSRRLLKARVLRIDRERDPGRTYFVLYYRTFLMDARLRGLVHTSHGVDAGRLEPYQEWRAISGGWHAYLMIDS